MKTLDGFVLKKPPKNRIAKYGVRHKKRNGPPSAIKWKSGDHKSSTMGNQEAEL